MFKNSEEMGSDKKCSLILSAATSGKTIHNKEGCEPEINETETKEPEVYRLEVKKPEINKQKLTKQDVNKSGLSEVNSIELGEHSVSWETVCQSQVNSIERRESTTTGLIVNEPELNEPEVSSIERGECTKSGKDFKLAEVSQPQVNCIACIERGESTTAGLIVNEPELKKPKVSSIERGESTNSSKDFKLVEVSQPQVNRIERGESTTTGLIVNEPELKEPEVSSIERRESTKSSKEASQPQVNCIERGESTTSGLIVNEPELNEPEVSSIERGESTKSSKEVSQPQVNCIERGESTTTGLIVNEPELNEPEVSSIERGESTKSGKDFKLVEVSQPQVNRIERGESTTTGLIVNDPELKEPEVSSIERGESTKSSKEASQPQVNCIERGESTTTGLIVNDPELKEPEVSSIERGESTKSSKEASQPQVNCIERGESTTTGLIVNDPELKDPEVSSIERGESTKSSKEASQPQVNCIERGESTTTGLIVNEPELKEPEVSSIERGESTKSSKEASQPQVNCIERGESTTTGLIANEPELKEPEVSSIERGESTKSSKEASQPQVNCIERGESTTTGLIVNEPELKKPEVSSIERGESTKSSKDFKLVEVSQPQVNCIERGESTTTGLIANEPELKEPEVSSIERGESTKSSKDFKLVEVSQPQVNCIETGESTTTGLIVNDPELKEPEVISIERGECTKSSSQVIETDYELAEVSQPQVNCIERREGKTTGLFVYELELMEPEVISIQREDRITNFTTVYEPEVNKPEVSEPYVDTVEVNSVDRKDGVASSVIACENQYISSSEDDLCRPLKPTGNSNTLPGIETIFNMQVNCSTIPETETKEARLDMPLGNSTDRDRPLKGYRVMAGAVTKLPSCVNYPNLYQSKQEPITLTKTSQHRSIKHMIGDVGSLSGAAHKTSEERKQIISAANAPKSHLTGKRQMLLQSKQVLASPVTDIHSTLTVKKTLDVTSDIYGENATESKADPDFQVDEEIQLSSDETGDETKSTYDETKSTYHSEPKLFIKPISKSNKTSKKNVTRRTNRVYNKKQACVYCTKLKSKISDHLIRCHSEEREVTEIIVLKAELKNYSDPALRSEKEKVIKNKFSKLRSQGNFVHNMEVLKRHEGELVPKRRPKTVRNDFCTSYVPCPYCLDLLFKQDLHKHLKTCRSMPKDADTSAKVARFEGETLLGVASVASSPLKRNVLPSMRGGEISRIAKSDNLILQLGDSQYAKSKKTGLRRVNLTSQKMRDCARLLDAARRIDPEHETMHEFIHPQKFDTLVKAAQSLAGQLTKDELRRPSVALRMGHLLESLAQKKLSLALQSGNAASASEARDFLTVKKSEWYEKISAGALADLTSRKFNKVTNLPKAEDIQSLSSYLIRELKRSERKLEDYRNTQILVLVRLLTFNRRRPGELEQLL